MPTYQYKCSACDHLFEKLQSMSSGALRKCPKCKKLKLIRLIGSGSALIFKGDGFYETDYNRSEEYKKKTKADNSAKPPKKEKTNKK